MQIRSTLPRQESHQNVMGTKSYEPIHRNGSASNSRSSWAGLPSAGGGAAATATAAAAVGGAPSEFTYQNRNYIISSITAVGICNQLKSIELITVKVPIRTAAVSR